jgi:hypothetical protein
MAAVGNLDCRHGQTLRLVRTAKRREVSDGGTISFFHSRWRGFFGIDPLYGGVASSPIASARLREGEPRARCTEKCAGRLASHHPDGTIIGALHYSHVPSEENDKVFGNPQSFVPGPLRTFSSWSRTQKSTPPLADGGSLTSTKTANLATRLYSKPVPPATRRVLATLSSPVTHFDAENHKRQGMRR